jgi:hypothetical protein
MRREMRGTVIFKKSSFFMVMICMLPILFLIWVCPLQAATYYVSSSIGDDLNNGKSQQTPWKYHPWMSKATSLAGNTVLQPGDKVRLKRGDVWYDYLTLQDAGTQNNLIITNAYGPGYLPRIICPTKEITTGWTRISGNIYRIPINHGGEDLGWVWQGDVSLDSALQMRSDSNVSEGEFFFDYVNDTRGYLYLHKIGGGSPNGTPIHYSSKKYVIDGLGTAAGYVRFENIELWGGNWGSVVVSGNWQSPRSNIELYHLIVRFSGSSESSENANRTTAAISIVNFSNCAITNSRIIHTAGYGIRFMAVSDSIIANNVVRYHSAGNGQWSGGIKILGQKGSQDPLNIIVEHNSVYRAMRPTNPNGIWTDVGARNVTIRYNEIYSGKNGIQFENGSAYNSAYYNIIVNCRNGFKLGTYGIPGNLGVFHNEIYNNLIVNSEISFALLHDAIGTNTIKNNISFNPTRFHVKLMKDYFSNGHLYMDYNCFFPKAVNGFLVLKGKSPNLVREKKDAGEWQESGYDLLSIFADPRFENSKFRNYHLLDDSPCIDAGADVGLARDMEEVFVPQGPSPDIGPYEYESFQSGPAAPANVQILSGLNADFRF